MALKIAYLAQIATTPSGVSKKILAQMETWQTVGNTVQHFFLMNAPSEHVPGYVLWKRFNLLNPLLNVLWHLFRFQPDIIYMRNMPISLFYFLLVLFFRKRIVLEINSIEKEEMLAELKSRPEMRRTYMFMIWANPLVLRLIRGIVCVSLEIAQNPAYSGVSNTFVAPNRIPLSQKKIVKLGETTHPIQLFFLGSPGLPWHGTDKMIPLAQHLGSDFFIHLIGPAPHELGPLPENVACHGYLPEQEYTQIIQHCHIAIASAALHRNNMEEASPLKVLEYAAGGFPIIIPYNDSNLHNPHLSWVLHIPNTENNLTDKTSVEAIRSFCYKNQHYVVSHKEAAPFVDMLPVEAAKMQCIAQWLNPSHS